MDSDILSLIRELFDFGSQTWSSRYAHFANIAFEDERELCELLDLDAEGEMDPDIDSGFLWLKFSQIPFYAFLHVTI
jgi:hypothetical protein